MDLNIALGAAVVDALGCAVDLGSPGSLKPILWTGNLASPSRVWRSFPEVSFAR